MRYFVCYDDDVQNYEEIAITLAEQAGEIMRISFHSSMKKEWKEDNTPLTASDTAINNLVLKTIGEAFPEHKVLGEEGSNNKQSDYVWVLDPIDGTIPFSHSMPLFVFSLALTYRGESILGVIYDPILDRMLYAQKGKGTYLNGQPSTSPTRIQLIKHLLKCRVGKATHTISTH